MDHVTTVPSAPLQAPRTPESHSYGLNLHLGCIEEEARCLIEAGDALITSKHTVIYKTKKKYNFYLLKCPTFKLPFFKCKNRFRGVK